MSELALEKSEGSKTVFSAIKSYAEELKRINQQVQEKKPGTEIFVSRVVAQAATVYEKMRNIIDYREEHLLRRNAIERMLNRLIKIHPSAELISATIVKELVSSAYLKENEVNLEKIENTKEIIGRYLSFIHSLSDKSKRYFLGVASAEIENDLVSHAKEEAVIKAMQKVVTHDLEKINYRELENKNFSDQLYIVIHLVFLKSDNSIIRCHQFRRTIDNWRKFNQDTPASQITGGLSQARLKIERQIALAKKSHLNKIVQVYKPLFLVLQNIGNQNPEVFEEYLSSPVRLSNEIGYLVEDRYQEIREKVKRSIIRAVLFIFLTKMILGVIFEIPYDLYIVGNVKILPLLVNLMFPPFLMFISYFMINVPDQKNTDKLVKGISGVVYNETDYDLLRKKIQPTKRGPLLSKILRFLYILTFLITISLIIWILVKLNFNLVSALVFFFFLSVVSFFAFRIRQGANELTVVEEKEGVAATIMDFIFLPFLQIGHWISVRFASINIFLFIFDFIIEAPFKILLEIIDHWLAYIREKKEEISS